MENNREKKKGFWATLFAPRHKSSCCCGQIEYVAEGAKTIEAPHSERRSEDNGTKVIKVLGTGCSSCKALYATVQEAVAQLKIDASVEKEENLERIMEYGVMSLPALVVNDKVVAKGQNLTVGQVKSLLR